MFTSPNRVIVPRYSLPIHIILFSRATENKHQALCVTNIISTCISERECDVYLSTSRNASFDVSRYLHTILICIAMQVFDMFQQSFRNMSSISKIRFKKSSLYPLASPFEININFALHQVLKNQKLYKSLRTFNTSSKALRKSYNAQYLINQHIESLRSCKICSLLGLLTH